MKDKQYERFLYGIQEHLAAGKCWVQGFDDKKCRFPNIAQRTLDRISLIEEGTVGTMDHRPCGKCTRAAQSPVTPRQPQGDLSVTLLRRDTITYARKRRNTG